MIKITNSLTPSSIMRNIRISSSSCRYFSTPATTETSLTNPPAPVAKKIPKYYDALVVEGKKNMSPQRAKELAEYALKKSLEAKSKTPSPITFTDYCAGDIDPLPENRRELAALTGMPEVHQNRRVTIRQRFRNPMQFGDNYSHQWQIVWKPSPKWSNPLTGYVSGADPMSSVKLFFNSKELAIDFAERNGWNYEISTESDPNMKKPGWRGYKHNFLPKKIASLPKKEKREWFSVSKYGSSHFVMPLKYHGDGIVAQHGGE